jgi:hypothetical protein
MGNVFSSDSNLCHYFFDGDIQCGARLSMNQQISWDIGLHFETVFLAFSRVENNLGPLARRILKMANPTRHPGPNRTLSRFPRDPFR